MNTAPTTSPRSVTERIADIDEHLEKAARSGCTCDTSARETAMHLRRAIRTLTTIVIDIQAETR